MTGKGGSHGLTGKPLLYAIKVGMAPAWAEADDEQILYQRFCLLGGLLIWI